MALLLLLIFSSVAAIVLVAFVALLISALRFGSRAVRTTGRITGHELDPEGSGASAVVTFYVEGRAFQAVGNGYEDIVNIPFGKEVPVLYLPHDPTKARVATSSDLFLPAIATGVAFVIVGGAASSLAALFFS